MGRYHEIELTYGGTVYTLYRPNNFNPAREDVYAAEYMTCTGKIIADRIGWRYSDMVMQWDAIPDDQLEALLSMSGECELTFDDEDGSHTEKIIRTGNSITATRQTGPEGTPLWFNVECGIRFLTTH